MSLIKKIESTNPTSIRMMFDRIAPTYDLLNRLMSFGLDIRWRKRAVNFLQEKTGGDFLDIAAGSGDVSIEMLHLQPASIIASDFSMNMLVECQKKIDANNASKIIYCTAADALKLPFRSNNFDATIVAFGIRNFANRLQSLQEMHRVLKTNGISIILELTQPSSPIITKLYYLHSKFLLPFIGKIISRHNSAYTYLPESIELFPKQNDFIKLMNQAGFLNARAFTLTFGTATIFIGEKLDSAK
jgi:demethylmenaquinone methyltransferase / 2-methoxy-6-polyprenyl-1,4-benzoquinol methylase